MCVKVINDRYSSSLSSYANLWDMSAQSFSSDASVKEFFYGTNITQACLDFIT